MCAITTLTTLRFDVELDENDEPVEEVDEWVLDLSRLTTLHLAWSSAVKDKQVLELSHLTGLTELSLSSCRNMAAEGLCAVSNLIALTTLHLSFCNGVTDEVVRAVIK